MAREKHDPVSEAAVEAVNMEALRLRNEREEREKREALIATTHRMIGQIRAADMLGQMATVSSLVWLKDVRESKIYRDLPDIGSWEAFCGHIGRSRSAVDEQLQNLETFGAEFLETVSSMRVGYRDLRKLRRQITEGTVTVDDEAVMINEERIPLKPEAKEDLEAAIERALEDRDRVIADRDAQLRTKDRLVDAKNDVIHRQEQDLAKATEDLERVRKGIFPGEEEEFLRKAASWKQMIHGFARQFDPDFNPLPRSATPRMKAELVAVTGYWARVMVSLYRGVVELYGEPEVDDGYQPDYFSNLLRPEGDEQS